MKSSVPVFALTALLVLPASAAPFGIKPDTATIDAKNPVAEFVLSSLSARTTIFEVRVNRWTQTADGDTYTPADMRIVPAVFPLSAYETRLIRIEPRNGSLPQDSEQSYRVTIAEVVPGQTSPPPAATRFDAVLFIPPRTPSGDAKFAISTTAKDAQLTVTNTANHHVYVGPFTIEMAGKELYHGPALGYVLAGTTRVFPITLAGAPETTGAELRFDDERGSQQSAALRMLR